MTRDQFLTEKVLGECWHEPVFKVQKFEDYKVPLDERDLSCRKCQRGSCENYNFSTWQHFGILWNFCKAQEWWDNFWEDYVLTLGTPKEIEGREWYNRMINWIVEPDTFADAIARYLEWERQKGQKEKE